MNEKIIFFKEIQIIILMLLTYTISATILHSTKNRVFLEFLFISYLYYLVLYINGILNHFISV